MDLDFGTSIACFKPFFFFFLLYSANLTTTFSNMPQTFPSSLAANQVSMSDHISSNWWHLSQSLVLFSSSFHNFCFSMFVHSSAFTLLALNLISSVSLLATDLYQWEGTGPYKVGYVACAGSFRRKSTTKTCWEASVMRESGAKLK